ncbi:MAG TPA: hypothetical protein DCM39_04065, partial [Pantoea sp.]|nr:hypothetical protein [Pantoea sp.]
MALKSITKKQKRLFLIINLFTLSAFSFSGLANAVLPVAEKNSEANALLQDQIRKQQLIPKPHKTVSEKKGLERQAIRFP